MSFCYMQLQSKNHPAANSFYKSLFGWTMDTSVPDYTEVTTGGAVNAGIMPQVVPGQGSNWLPFVAVSDLESSVKSAQKLDAKLVVPPTDVPGKGRYAVIIDPTGAAIGMWQQN